MALDESCRVSRASAETFTVASASNNASRTVYLSAESAPLAEEWVRVLQNVIQRNALRLLLFEEGKRRPPTLQGWLTKVKHGHSKKLWCVLVGKMFVYFKAPGEQVSWCVSRE